MVFRNLPVRIRILIGHGFEIDLWYVLDPFVISFRGRLNCIPCYLHQYPIGCIRAWGILCSSMQMLLYSLSSEPLF